MTEDASLPDRRPEDRDRDRSAPWIAVIAVALALAVALYFLLGGDDEPDNAASPTPTTTATETATTDTAEPTEEPTTAEPTETATTTEPTETATEEPTTATPTETATDEPTSTPEPTYAPVDPAAYHDEDLGAYFFTAFDEQLRCGLFTEGDTRLSGCQGTVVVASLPECDSPDSNAPIVTLGESGPAFPECTTQGIFVAEETPELGVGQSITADTVTCARSEGAVACHDEETGYGFLASLEEFTAVP